MDTKERDQLLIKQWGMSHAEYCRIYGRKDKGNVQEELQKERTDPA